MVRERWWPYRREGGEDVSTDSTKDAADAPGWRQPLTGVALRMVAAMSVLIPSAVLLLRIGEPFAISAMASTAAIVLHSPDRFHRKPGVIAACYVLGLVVSVPISVAGAVVGAAGLLSASISAAVIVATPLGRIHPPTACIPLAITSSAAPAVLLTAWAWFAAVAVFVLVALWLFTWTATLAQR